ncbi:MAG: AtpZ/AtpI family protein [Pseudomonadota bacterium]
MLPPGSSWEKCSFAGFFALDKREIVDLYMDAAIPEERGLFPCFPWKTRELTIFFDFKKNEKWIDNIALVTQLGLTMAGSILFCFAIGYYLDKWLGTKGLFITIFILLGVAGGGYTAYRQIMEGTRGDKENKG